MKHNLSKKLLGYLSQHDLADIFFNDRNFRATFYCEKLLAFFVRRNGNFVEVIEETESRELQSAVFILQPGKGRLRVVSDWNEVALTSEEVGDQSL